MKKKMFIWQVKHVFIRLKETLREAVRQPTFADGMQAREPIIAYSFTHTHPRACSPNLT